MYARNAGMGNLNASSLDALMKSSDGAQLKAFIERWDGKGVYIKTRSPDADQSNTVDNSAVGQMAAAATARRRG